jgi:hypothetical protein
MKNIHVIPTDKPSRLFIDVDDNKLKICVPLGGEHMMNQNIYITSEEEIKDGDWVIDDEQDVFQVLEINHTQGILRSDGFTYVIDICKKIILTTNEELIKNGVQSIENDFLKWFVNNPSCEFVEVKKVESMYLDYVGNIRTSISYKIIFSKEESRQKMNKELEEVAEKYAHNYFEMHDTNHYKALKQGFEAGAKYMQERMYNEQDMSEAFMACWKANVPEGVECLLSFKEWLKEFKNK